MLMPLSLRMLFREWRSGELSLLALALVAAVSCITILNNFAFLIQSQLGQQASQLLGANRMISSSVPIKNSWKSKAKSMGLKQTEALIFLSMINHGDRLQLAQVKAIQTPYPLIGHLTIGKERGTDPINITQAPPVGQVWLDKRIFLALNIHPGDSISIGSATFIASAIILEEPGQNGDWFTISPRVLMNQADVAKTGVVQLGSNLSYNWLLTGTEQQFKLLRQAIDSELTEQQRWLDSTTSNQAVQEALEKTLIYLNIGGIMSLILASVAISLASLRYCQRHQQHVAVLRCFGASQKKIISLYFANILLLGTLSCLLGVLVGYLVHPILLHWLHGFLPELAAPFSLKPALVSFFAGLLILSCFTLIHLWRLKQVTAIHLFREEAPNWDNSLYLSYGLSFLLLGGLSYLYTASWTLSFFILLACYFYVFLVVSSLLTIFGLLSTARTNLSLNWRFGFINIFRNINHSALQIIGTGLALTVILSLSLLRTQLLADWQKQLPPDASNYFIINIEPVQVEALIAFLQGQKIRQAQIYPIVRGRLISINNKPVQEIFGPRATKINALQRELNLSWSSSLPADNHLTQGQWTPTDLSLDWLSIEQGLAEQLGVKIGDTLEFRIVDKKITAQIASIRSINWISFKPNFFILFKPGLLDAFPQTEITSIYLPEQEQEKLLMLVQQFPNATIIDIANMIEKLRTIFNNTGKAISFLTLFTLLSGLIITALAMLSLSQSKAQETQLFRTLGMRRLQLLWIKSSEAFFIGFYAGILAIGIAMYINYYLTHTVLHLSFYVPWTYLLFTPLLTALGIMLLHHGVTAWQYRRNYQGINT